MPARSSSALASPLSWPPMPQIEWSFRYELMRLLVTGSSVPGQRQDPNDWAQGPAALTSQLQSTAAAAASAPAYPVNNMQLPIQRSGFQTNTGMQNHKLPGNEAS